MRRTWLAAALVLLLGGSGASAQSSSGWLGYGNDLARTSFTDESLSPSSVRPAWYIADLRAGQLPGARRPGRSRPGPEVGLRRDDARARLRAGRERLRPLASRSGPARARLPAGRRLRRDRDARDRPRHARALRRRRLRPRPRARPGDGNGAQRVARGRLQRLPARARVGGAHARRRLDLPRDRFVLRPQDGRQGFPSRPCHACGLALGGRAEPAGRRRKRLGLGRARVQRVARLPVRRDGQRVRGRREHRQALSRVRRPRRADRRARPRPARPRLEPSARHPSEDATSTSSARPFSSGTRPADSSRRG